MRIDMSVQVFVTTQEGFLTNLGVKLENGLMLKAHFSTGGNLAWAGKEVRVDTINKFEEFLDGLEKLGFEIIGRDILDEYK